MGGIALIIGVMVIVAGISLYDYFSARRWQQVTSEERLELVFANRNREYGAYEMRKGYNFRLLIIIGAMFFAIGSTYGIYRIIQAIPAEEIEEPELDLTQFSMNAPEIEEPLDPPVEEEIPPMEKTIQFLPPVVTDDEVDTPPPVDDELDKTKASTETNETENENFQIAETKKEKKEEETEKKKEEIIDFPDEPAAFKGNVQVYLRDNIKYPPTAIELGLEGKCHLKFIVSAKGNISNVTVERGVTDCPECDKEAVRVVKGMPDWTPGKVGGKPVNSTFRLPVKFQLQ